jgi:hypothetical protein
MTLAPPIEELKAYVPNLIELQEYQMKLEASLTKENEVPVKYIEGKPVEWLPQDGSQFSFMACVVFEALLHGPRGTGKTDVLVMDFARDCEQGYGADWRGVIFRESYPQLADVVAKTKKWFPRIFGNRVSFNESSMVWTWKSGEQLFLRHVRTADDYYKYHGFSFTWLGFEELTNWAASGTYTVLISLCRTDNQKLTHLCRVRSTCNPYGPGHTWVKFRFRLPELNGVILLDAATPEGKPEPPRVAIQAFWGENKILLAATPNYASVITAAARNASERAAWLEGRWDIVAGGILDEAWILAEKYALVDEFEIPSSWRIYRAYDHGESKPFSCGWYAISDGTWKRPTRCPFIPGDIIRIREWYGWTGQPNVGKSMTGREIAAGIIEREMEWGIHGRVRPGPADGVFTKVNQQSIAEDMEKPVKINGKWWNGVAWEEPEKGAGSRVAGADRMRTMLKATIPSASGIREEPGFFLFRTSNPQWLRTVPGLPRDPKKPDDADTTSEDHPYDESRYMVQWEPNFLEVTRQ